MLHEFDFEAIDQYQQEVLDLILEQQHALGEEYNSLSDDVEQLRDKAETIQNRINDLSNQYDDDGSKQSEISSLESQLGDIEADIDAIESRMEEIDALIQELKAAAQETINFVTKLKERILEADGDFAALYNDISELIDEHIFKMASIMDRIYDGYNNIGMSDVGSKFLMDLAEKVSTVRGVAEETAFPGITDFRNEKRSEFGLDEFEATIMYFAYLEKDKIMREMGIKTDIEFNEFVMSQIELYRLSKEYEGIISDYYAGKTIEGLWDLMGERSPYHDFLFLSSGDMANSFTLEQRRSILNELNKNGGIISNDFISKLVGYDVHRTCNTMVEWAYDLSGKNTSILEQSIEWNKRQLRQSQLLFNYMVMTTGMAYQYNYLNPSTPRPVSDTFLTTEYNPRPAGTWGSDNYNMLSPMSGAEWYIYFKRKYGADNVRWMPQTLSDIQKNPQLLYGLSQSEVAKILGDGWTPDTYGSAGNGWKYLNGDISIWYHPGGGRHTGSYYGITSGATGRIKIVDRDYIPLPGDNAIIIYMQ